MGSPLTPTELLALRGARLRSAIARSGDLAMLLEATAMEREASKPRRSVLSYLWARVSALSATTPETQELPPGDSMREVQPVGVPGGGDAPADTLATGGPAPEPEQLDARDAGLIEGTDPVPTTGTQEPPPGWVTLDWAAEVAHAEQALARRTALDAPVCEGPSKATLADMMTDPTARARFAPERKLGLLDLVALLNGAPPPTLRTVAPAPAAVTRPTRTVTPGWSWLGFVD